MKLTDTPRVKNIMAKNRPAVVGGTKYKKAPDAPRRFKSSYMFFSTEKHRSIREELAKKGKTEKTTNIAKMVSKAWKELPNDERQSWNDRADRDKERYEVEKTMYSGPWKVRADKKKADKDPDAPKRPMSAFLSFSHTKRSEVRESNPNLSNAETCRILAQLWKCAPDEVKKPHIDREFKLRQEYKAAIAVWREEAERKKTLERQSREDVALRAVADIKMRKQGTTAAHYGGAQEEHLHYDHHHGETMFTAIDEATTPFFTRNIANEHALMESYPSLYDTTMPPSHYTAPGIQYTRPQQHFPLPPSSREYYAYHGVDELPLQLHYYSTSHSYPPSRTLRPPPEYYRMMGPPTTSTSSWGYGMATSTGDEHSASYQDTSGSAGTTHHLTSHHGNY